MGQAQWIRLERQANSERGPRRVEPVGRLDRKIAKDDTVEPGAKPLGSICDGIEPGRRLGRGRFLRRPERVAGLSKEGGSEITTAGTALRGCGGPGVCPGGLIARIR